MSDEGSPSLFIYGSVITHGIYVFCFSRLPASKTAAFSYLQPIVVAMHTVVFSHNHISKGEIAAEAFGASRNVSLRQKINKARPLSKAWSRYGLASCQMFLPMELTEAQYERIKDALPVQRGNVSLEHLASTQLSALCGGAGLQMAWSSEAVRPLAYRLHADKSMVQGWCSGSGVR